MRPASDAPHALVRRLDESLRDDERLRFVQWARGLLALRESGAPATERAADALRLTRDAGVVVPALRASGRGIVRVAWKDRTWAARFAFGGVAVAAAAYGGQSAGIAALGTAVGVPLWVVFGAGGAFAGMLADELEATLARGGRPVPPRTGPLPPDLEEAEWELVDAAVRAADADADAAALPRASAREPLGRVFVRAFREARTRQRRAEDAAARDSQGDEQRLTRRRGGRGDAEESGAGRKLGAESRDAAPPGHRGNPPEKGEAPCGT